MSWTPPATLEEFRILRPLGAGAMGQVFLAHDTILDREVAIKFIAGLEVGAGARERFFTEARAVARLSHPNVVAIHRVGELKQRPYLVSEYIAGTSLASVIKPVQWQRVVRIGIGLARGLGAAHHRGVLHRDIKPANVMLDVDDEAKLLDFGLAKLVGSTERRATVHISQTAALDATMSIAGRPIQPGSSDRGPGELTAAGSLVGTPLYLAPECWRGEPASTRSDVYSLGVVLYELLAGRVPHVTVSMSELEVQITTVDPAPISTHSADLPARLAALIDACVARDPDRRPADSDELCTALEALQPTQVVSLDDSPYRGLARFEPEHRAVFFGRSDEAREIVERLRTETLVVVAGDSGAGKSSLCRAAVLPAVAEKALAGQSWRVTKMIPGTHPLARLEEALATRIAGEGLLLFIDQFEELLTIADPSEANAAAERIAELVVAGSHIRVLATVRSDFLGRLAGMPLLGELIGRALYLLGPLGDRGLRDAIVGPARTHGYTFSSADMVDALVVSGRRHLPLLQFTLSELWSARDEVTHTIPADALEAMGGVAGALARRADQVMASLGADDRQIAWRVFVRLTTAEGTRAVMSRAELAEVVGPSVDRVVERLVSARLLSVNPDADDQVEVVHEALFSSWPALVEWRRSHEQGARMRDAISEAARRWQERGRARGLLWRDDALVEYRRWKQRWAERLTGVESAFVAACEAENRRTRRGRMVALGLTIALLSIGIVVLYRSDRRASDERDLAEARQRDAELQRRTLYVERGMQELAAGKSTRAMPFLLEAMREGDATPALRLAMGEATRPLEREIARNNDFREGLSSIVWHRDGARIAAAGSAGEVRLYDARGNKLRDYLSKSTTNNILSYSSDGRFLVATDPNGSIRAWDVETGAIQLDLAGTADNDVGKTTMSAGLLVAATKTGVTVHDVASLAVRYKINRAAARAAHWTICDHQVSKDDQRLYVAFNEGWLATYDFASGRELTRWPIATTNNRCTLQMSNDGKWLAVTASKSEVFDLTTGRQHATFAAGHYMSAFSPDSVWLATSSLDGVTQIWDLASSSLVHQLVAHGTISMDFSPDSRHLTTAGSDLTFRIWDLRTGVQESMFEATATSPGKGTALAVGARFSGDGATLVTAAGNELRWLRTASHTLLHEVSLATAPSSGRLSPDERHAVVAGLLGEVQIVDLATDVPIAYRVVADHLWDIGWSNDGRRLAASGRQGFAALLDAKDLSTLHRLVGHAPTSSVNRITYSPDGRLVITAGGDSTARIWDADRGTARGVIRQPGPVMSATWSPDQKLIATADWNHAIRIWDAVTLAPITELHVELLKFLDVSFSPDSKRIVATTHAGVVKIWDLATRQQTMTLLGHSGPVTSAVFSPDGQFLATSSSDTTARIWDVATGREIAQRRHGGEALQVTWNRAGTAIIVATPHPGLRVWNVARDHRSLAELDAFAAQHVPWRLVDGRLERIDR